MIVTNIDIITAHYAASDRGDLAGMVADFAPDIEWTEAAGFPLAGTYIGPEAVVQGVFARLQADWADFAATVDDVFDAGSTVVAIGNYSGRNRVTAQAFRARFVHVWRLEGGVVRQFEQVVDSSLVVAAMR